MATVVTLLSYVLLVCSVSAQTCDSGWFGPPLCQYKCRCRDNCEADGQCTRGRCLGGWFGPACQYDDLAYSSQLPITDGDDSTCWNTPVGNTVQVNLFNPTVFSWLRVRVSTSDYLQRITVKFNVNKLDCLNPRNSSVDDNTLDIYCDVDVVVQSVTLSGDGVQYLCSVYVSGGRNVALRQHTAQSSNYSYGDYTFSSSLSVDGNTDNDFNKKSCSCTQPDLTVIPNWNVSFSRPQKVQRYSLYNRDAQSGTNNRMIGFNLQSFSVSGTPVFNYTDPKSQPQSVYTIVPPANVTSPVSVVSITGGYNSITNKDRLLQMCEVEVYGDSACDRGKYGRECEYDCNCEGGEACFISTGGCPSGCKTGFYGESCDLPCRPGKFGLRCDKNCSEFCAIKNVSDERSCNHVDGTCFHGCSSGYLGQQCFTKCPTGTYGSGCSQSCSPFCVKNVSYERSCDHVNGSCFSGCQSGYNGSTCSSQCPKGSYGQDCNFNCSSFCVPAATDDKSSCDHITGTCLFGCAGDYDPLFCKQDSDNETKVIIGAVVGSILGVILVALIIFAVIIFRRRYKNPKSSDSINGNVASLSGAAISTSSSVKNSKNKPQAKKVNDTKEGVKEVATNASHGTYYNTLALSSQNSTVLSLDGLEEFMASKDKDFFKNQFSAIPANETGTMKVGMSAENKSKNRYKNICAYDHSRVNLIPNVAKKHGDYINASYIDGYKSDEKFIASQGPTKVMLEDFVRMLWEQQVEKVVMLTNLVEEGKQKCEKYWPEDGKMKVGEITVRLTTTQVFADYTIRRLQLKKEGQPGQDFIHFHFTSWPDKDIPNTPWGLIDFEQRVASYPSSKPTVVHCSAGVGRTGTFIALRNVMRQAEETGQMDFFTTVQKLRQDRINMVQTIDQYIFLHRAALVAMLCIGTTVTFTDIQTRIQELQTKMSSGQTKMEKEFKSICSVCDVKEEAMTFEENPYSIYENSQTVVNKLKNRDNSILPKEMYRAKLNCERSELGDYINAVLVPSFSKQNQQVLTQLPQPATVVDFWRLVIQYQVSLIVAFDVDLRATDPTIADYLSLGDGVNSSLFKITTEPESNAKNWKQQKLVITMKADLGKLKNVTSTEHKVTHLTSTSTTFDKITQLDFVQHIRSMQQKIGEGRTVYMCRNGATYSGLACVLALLLDRMDNDQLLTVPLVVGAVKAIRPEIIPTLDQYKLLYDVLEYYSNTISEYSNIGSSIS